MNKTMILILLILFIIYFYKFHINIYIFISRGIIVPNKFWWKINDLFIGKHELSNYLDKYRKGDHSISLLGVNLKIVSNINDVRHILENSPNIFKRGTIKYNFFKPLMQNNVGITYDTDLWIKRRKLNETVLGTHILKYNLITYLNSQIVRIINDIQNYSSRDNFIELGKKITKLIVFGHLDISDKIFDLIKTPSFVRILYPDNTNYDKEWTELLKISKIETNSLLGRLKEHNIDFDNEIIQQIPHWIFPIFGSVSITLPRLLLLDSLYSKDDIPIKNRILETLRLYNPVVTLFRLDPNTNIEYLIFIQMFLRDPEYFPNPHEYNPNRWYDKNLEFKVYNLIFSQGPQICPGKNLILFLLEILFTNIQPIFKSKKKLDLHNLPDSLNPFDLF